MSARETGSESGAGEENTQPPIDLDADLIARAGGFGVEIRPTREGETPEVAATGQLIDLARGVYDIMAAAGTFALLGRSDQRGLRKLARLEEEDPKDYVGAVINGLRIETGVSQAELAEELGVHPSTLVRFLWGQTHPRANTLLLPVLQLLWERPQMPLSNPEEVRPLIEGYLRERYQKGSARNLNERTKERRIAADTEKFYRQFLRSIGIDPAGAP